MLHNYYVNVYLDQDQNAKWCNAKNRRFSKNERGKIVRWFFITFHDFF